VKTGAADRPAVDAVIMHAATRLIRGLLGLLLLGMVLLNVVNALGRHLFGRTLVGADELLVFTMIWIVMIGLILVTIERGHIALDFLASRLSPRLRLALAALHHAVMTVVSAYAALQSLSFVRRVAAVGQTSMGLAMPMEIPHFALVVGLAGTAVVGAVLLAGDLVALTRTGRGKTTGP
jgi:TRAP-type C4-dicarboxylate transport system permease small subunit